MEEDLIVLWLRLPYLLRKYYVAKGMYYAMRHNGRVFAPAVIVILAGLVSFYFKVPPFFSIVLILIGIILGVIVVWEIERRG